MLQGKLNVEKALKRAKGIMKGAKSWQELEAEMYNVPFSERKSF